MLRECHLGRCEQCRLDDGWHAEGEPVTLRTGAASGFRDALAFAPGGIPTIGGISQYFADRLMAPDSLTQAVGQATAFRVAISGRGDVLTGQNDRNTPGGYTLHAQLKDALHQGSLLRINLPAPCVGSFDIPIPQGDGPTPRMSSLNPSYGAPLHAFKDFGALILGKRPAHLKEEPALRALFQGMGDDT